MTRANQVLAALLGTLALGVPFAAPASGQIAAVPAMPPTATGADPPTVNAPGAETPAPLPPRVEMPRAPSDPAPPPAAGPLRGLEFYYEYVPQEIFDQVSKGFTTVPAMRKEEFLQHLQTLRSATGGAADRGVVLAAARYQLRLGDGLLAGTTEFEIRHAGPTGLLSLAGFRAAVSEASWKDQPARPVLFGTGADGQPAVVVDGPGTLVLKMSLRAVRDRHGEWELPLALPAAPVQRLLLDLPAELMPLAAGQRILVARSSDAPPPRTPPETRWQIDVTGAWAGRLRCVSASGTAAGRPPILVQTTAYLFGQRGGEVTSRLKLTPRGAWPAELSLALDPGLELLSVSFGDRLLPVARNAAPGAGGAKNYRVSLVELPDSPVDLVLRASTEMVTGKAWKLPAARVGGAAWQEELLVVSVQSPLALLDATGEHARISQSAELPPPEGNTIEFRADQPDARATVTLLPRTPQWQVQSATQVTFGSSTTRGTQTLSLSTTEGDLFAFQTDLSPGWVLDTVEATPPELLDDWELTAGGGGGRLQVAFRRGIGAGRPARLTLRAHRSAAPTQATWGPEFWHICRLAENPASKRRVALVAEPPLRVRLVDENGLTRLDPGALPPAEAALWASPPQGILFVDEPRLAALQSVLDVEPPRFAAEIQSDLLLQAGRQAAEKHVVTCVPEGTSLRRVWVQIAPSAEEDLRWSFGKDEAPGPAARRLSVEEQQVLGLSERGEVWEIVCPKPQSAPFALRGERKRGWTTALAAPLATAPFASAQSGRLTVRTSPGVAASVAARALEPLPLPAPLPSEPQQVAGVFRYEPARDVLAAGERSAFVSAPGEQTALPQCWSAHLTTWALPEDEWRHTVSYLLEAGPAERFRFALPPTGVLRRVWVQGEPEETPAARGGWFSLALPPRVRYVRIDAEFTTPGQDFSRIDPAACWPQPAGGGRRAWSLWLPREWRLTTSATGADRPRDDWAWRLFGSLARAPQDTAPSLIARGGWRTMLPGAPAAAQTAADQFLDHLASASRSRPGAWGPLMRKLADELRAQPAGPANLWIDAAALGDARLTPTAPIAGTCEDRAQAAALLRRAGLIAELGPQGWLVTTADRLPPDVELRQGCVHAEETAGLRGDDFDAVPAALWTAGRTPRATAWPALPAELRGIAPGGAWDVHAVHVPPDALPPTLSAAAVGRHELGTWLLLLAACALAWALPAGARTATAALAAVAATAALLVPPDLAPWATALWQGLSLGLLATLLWTPPAPDGEPGDSTLSTTPPLSARGAAALVLLLLCLTRAGDDVRAAEPLAAAPPKMHRVLVKVDAQGKPADAYVHLTAAFYDELLRAARTLQTPAESFLLTDAEYKLRVEGDSAAGDVESVRLSVAWEIETLRSEAKVVLPFPQRGLQLVDSGALLDGLPVALDWREDAATLELAVPTAGPHRLQLTLRPTLARGPGRTELSIPIPPTPRARAEVLSKPPRAGLEIDSLGGTMNLGPGLVRADLGQSRRLTVRWQAGDLQPEGQAEVEQLAWLRIQPGTAVLDVRWRVRGTPLPAKLTIACDPRLKRLGAPAEAGGGSEGTGPERIEISLTRAGEGEATGAATFLVRGMTGVGHIRPTLCSASGLRMATNWLAVSADSSLVLGSTGTPAAALLPPARFSSRWLAQEPAPGLAVDLAATPEEDWRLTVAPRPVQTTAELTAALSFGDDRTQAAWAIDLEVSGGQLFSQRIKVPANLQIRSLAAADPDRERNCRWTRGPDGSVLVLFPEPVSGPCRLTILGDLPAASSGRFDWPAISLPDAALQSVAAEIYRQHERTVEAPPAEKWEAKAPGRPPLVPGRFVAAWHSAGPALRPPAVIIGQRRVKMQARLLTQLVRGAGGSAAELWQADTLLEIDVREGQLDALRLEIAPRLAAGLSLDPPLPIEVVPWAEENLSRLIITPANPIRGVLRLRLRVPAPLGLGERPRVPEINVLGAESVERYLAVGAPYDLAPLAGDTRLEPATFPAGLLPSTPPPAGGKSYRVVSPRFTAAIVRVERPAGRAQVRLVDVRAAWSAGGGAMLLTAFDLEPAGMAQCVLTLPEGQRLLGVQVDGVPIQVTPVPGPAAAPDRWTIGLGARQLPLRIEVAARAETVPLTTSAALRSFAVPTLAAAGEQGTPATEVPVLQTAWTVLAPAALDASRLPRHEQQISTRRQELARLSAWAAAVGLPGDSVAEFSSTDIAQWYLPWARRIAAGQSALARLEWSDPEWTPDETARLDAFEREQVLLAARLSVSGLRNQVSDEATPFPSPTRWWPAVMGEGGPATRLLFKGPAREVHLDYGAAADALHPVWILGAGLAAVLALVAVGRVGFVGANGWGWILAGLGGGALWWAYLSPDWVGFGIVAAALVAGVRKAFSPEG